MYLSSTLYELVCFRNVLRSKTIYQSSLLYRTFFSGEVECWDRQLPFYAQSLAASLQFEFVWLFSLSFTGPIQSQRRDAHLCVCLSVCAIKGSFHRIGPNGQFSLVVQMSMCQYVCMYVFNFFQGLSLALRSHDQILASVSLMRTLKRSITCILFQTGFFVVFLA